MTSLKPKSARAIRSPGSDASQSPHLSNFETIPYSAVPLLPRSPLRRLTLALLLTVAAALLLAALILYAPITALVEFKQQKLHNLQQTQQTMLDRAQSYRAQADEVNQADCIAEAHRLVDTKPQGQLYAQAHDVLKVCQDGLAKLKIAEAQRIADGHQGDAIALLSQIEGSMQPQAIALSRTWTEQILGLAKADYQKGKLPEAHQLMISIAPDNPLYAEAQADLQAWHNEQVSNDTALETAKRALQADQLDIAQTNLERITNHPFWQEKLQPVKQQLLDRQAECDRIYQEATQNIVQRNYSFAAKLAAQLPDAPPWGVLKHQIVQQLEAARQRDNTKAIGFSWLLGALSSSFLSLKLRKH
jgi:hypothetical protein